MIRKFAYLPCVCGVLFAAFSASSAISEPLPIPDGDVVLIVEGNIEKTNKGDFAEFDLAMLRSLDSAGFETETIWTEGLQQFAGVELGTLLTHVGSKGVSLSAYAANEYLIDIPAEDFESGAALIAYERNGAPMSVRDKGPLWLVYPYDKAVRFRSEVYYARSIWQLDRIEVHR
ncbi:molybdopterin-dependent oxidoreductase [Pelagimonas varians]|uniref:Oxidoreductase molybdopterin binding domain protein n=1 Tax=Pelagimonas varians TaxID=696760 RepID=A0A238K0J4_9RHOB|nr:molybdopterin-dependent oxidoreductase [Pelagimonas varians]PYG33338.1 hypothetical protein C8N36_102336 [Pelagimonas varians]SMX36405.1 Oxidoreductase molybdopterin binding domain protein [Pelagimonas varians]